MADPYAGWTVDKSFTPSLPVPDEYAGWKVDDGFKPKISQTEDVLRGAGSGLATGVAGLPGILGDITSMGNEGLNKISDWVGKKLGYTQEEIDKTKAHGSPLFPTTEEVKKITGFDKANYEPQTTAGKYAKTIGEFVPGAATGGARTAAGIAGNVLKFGVAPGAASELAGQALKDTPYEGVGRVAAGLVTPGVTHFAMSPLRVGGSAASEASHAAHVARLEAEGIPVSAGERADSRGLRIVENELDPRAYKQKLENVTEAATRQVGNGRGGNYQTPIMSREPGNNTLDRMLSEVGQRFDDLSHRNTLHPDAQMGHDLVQLQQHYSRIPGAYGPETVNALNGASQHVMDLLMSNGAHPTTNLTHLTGAQYQRLRTDLGAAARAAGNDAHAQVLHDFVNTLDDAMERSIAAHNPRDAGLFPQVRRDYRNALVIEDASKATNVAGAEGYITPAKLEAAAAKVYGRRAHERGYDPFDWAPAAKSVLKIEPNSGTAHRQLLNVVNAGLGSMLGGLAGSLGGHAMGMHDAVEPLLILEHAAGLAAGPLLRGPERAAIMSGPGQRYLGNQWTRGQDNPYMSLPGLLTQAEQRQGEERKKPRLSITVP